MNDISQISIGPGSDICPSCKSDSWKSARMIIMEGTANIKGTLDGTITDPGRFSGGFNNFLLSDRWFSWDYPIEAEIGLTSSTGLVEEVKKLMVHYSSMVKMPTPLPEPTLTGIIKDAWKESREHPAPIKPQSPIEPKKPKYKTSDRPEYLEISDTSSVRKRSVQNLRALLPAIIIYVVISIPLFVFFPHLTILMFALFIIGALIAFSLITNIGDFLFPKAALKVVKKKNAEYESKNAENEKREAEYQGLIKNYQSEKEKYEKDIELYRAKDKEYKDAKDAQMHREIALAEKQQAEYIAKKNNAIKTRELLWERARVCTRCGTAYLGSNLEQEKIINDAIVINDAIITSNVTKRIMAVLENKKTDRLYVGNDISEIRLKNAKTSFPIDPNLIVLGLIDTTIITSCKRGLAITDKGLTWNNGMLSVTKKNNLSWDELIDRKTRMTISKNGIEFGDDIVFTMLDSDSTADVLELFVAIADEYASAINSTPNEFTKQNDKSSAIAPTEDQFSGKNT